MDRENRKHKRGRETKDKEKVSESEKYVKVLQELGNPSDDQSGENSKTSESEYLGSGVFDFPWLREGVISKTDDCMLQYMFASAFGNTWTEAGAELSGHGLWETPIVTSVDKSTEMRFEENALDSYEGDGLDGTWASLLNQPLEGGSV